MVEIIRAVPAEAAELKEIAVAAKGCWGYPQDLIDSWAQTPIITPEAVADGLVYKACVDGAAAGWYRLVTRALPVMLEDLWVLPAFSSRGVGRALFRHAVEQALGCGAPAFELDADPHAVPFYQRMECRVIGESLSEWGRMFPRMRYGP